jgi:hypothetical protein
VVEKNAFEYSNKQFTVGEQVLQGWYLVSSLGQQFEAGKAPKKLLAKVFDKKDSVEITADITGLRIKQGTKQAVMKLASTSSSYHIVVVLNKFGDSVKLLN